MARGKRSTSEGTATGDTMVLGDTEQAVKPVPAKVTLVKPDPVETTEEAAMESIVKSAPRPKVGRSGATRKKKSETGEPKTAKAEKKENKSRTASQEARPEQVRAGEVKSETVGVAAAQAAEPAATEVGTVETVSLAQLHAPLAATIEKPEPSLDIKEELAQADLPPDWDTSSRSRPDLKFTLFLLVLFAAVNIGLVFLLNGGHKAKTATANQESPQAKLPATPAQLGDLAPPAQPAAPEVPAAMTPAAQAPADESTAAKSAQLPPIPAAPPVPEAQAPSVPQKAAPVAPVAASPEPQAPAAAAATSPAESLPETAASPPPSSSVPASAPAEDKQDKVKNQQELLSILNKD